jgi:hypothetical protein
LKKTELEQLLRKNRRQPIEWLNALSAIAQGELLRGFVELFATGELRLHPRRRRRARSLCTRFYAYDKANPHVGGWFLSAAQALKQQEHRERYGIGALLEKIRWDVRAGIIKTDGFRIANDFQSCYVRQVLMRDPSLCGLFDVRRTSNADSLVVDGCTWTDFAKEHEAELWPEQTAKKKSVSANQPVLPLRETA